MDQNTRLAVVVGSARIHATVTDLPGVQRVPTLLTRRNYPLTRFKAEEAGGGHWRLSIETIAPQPDEIELLKPRPQRVPSPLVAHVGGRGFLPAAGQQG